MIPSACADVVINEIVADNETTVMDEDGHYSDWIELHNNGDEAVDLEGYYLTDDSTNLEAWEFESVSIPAGQFLVVFASDKDRADPASVLHTNFKLNNAGEYLALVEPDGLTIVSEFAPSFSPIWSDVAYGRGDDGEELGILQAATPGEANAGIAFTPEIISFEADPTELPFGGSTTLSWEVANVSEVSLFPGPTGLPPVGSLVVQPGFSRDYRLVGRNVTGTTSESIHISLGPQLSEVTATPSTIVPGGRTVLRWTALEERTVSLGDGFTTSVMSPLVYTPFNETLVPAGSSWSYLADGSDQGAAWKESGFDDELWDSGPGRFGFAGDPEVTTLIPEDGVTIYFRHAFTVDSPEDLHGLTLRMNVLAGAAVYLNGVEIARHRLPAGPIAFDTRALFSNPPSTAQDFAEYQIPADTLLSGTNLLAVEAHKKSQFANTFRFDAGLTAWRSAGAPGFTALTLTAENEVGSVSGEVNVVVTGEVNPVPPPNLVISEFLWEIDGAFGVEPLRFIEIYNAGEVPIDLSAGIQLIRDAAFDFRQSDIPILAGGSYALVVQRRDLFESVWGQGYPIAGEFQVSSPDWYHHAFFGLLAADGQTIEQFEYAVTQPARDPTYTRINLKTDPGFPENWQGNPIDDASPGERDVPRISNFYNPNQNPRARAGEFVNLLFTVNNALSARIDPDVGEIPIGVFAGVTVPIVAGGDQVYTLTAIGEFATVTKTVVIPVQPEILSFTATPGVVPPGGSVTLSWNVTGNNVTGQVQGVANISGGTGSISFIPLEDTFIPEISGWKYLDDGSDLGTAWSEPDYDDALWNLGQGVFGYGNDIEQTLTQFGHATNYFRKTFTIDDPSVFSLFYTDLLIDDGAQVFLNGDEVLRENLPEGDLNYQTVSLNSSPDDGRTYRPFELDPASLIAGENVIAVGAHNNWTQSDDFGFDLRLRGVRESASGYVTYRLQVSTGGGNQTADVTVRIGEATQGFEQWAIEMGIPAAESQHDFDLDGRSNLLEFLLGSRPDVPDVGSPIQVTRSQYGYLKLSFPRNPAARFLAAALVDLQIEMSQDLENWTPAIGVLRFEETEKTADPGVVLNTYRTIVPLDNAQSLEALYFRLVGKIQ